MRILITLCALSAFVVSNAADVRLEWDANPEPEVSSYTLHSGGASRSYTNTVSVTNTTARLPGLSPGVYYVAVTAHDTNGVTSDFSDELIFTVPKKPGRVRIVVYSPSVKVIVRGED